MKFKTSFGFTLIEILVYIGVFSVVFAALISFIIWVNKSNIKTQAMREVSDNLKLAMDKMIYEIRTAKSIYTPTVTSSQLSLETLNYLPEGETFSYIDFFLCGPLSDTLCLKKESQNPVALTSPRVKIDNLTFTLIGTSTSTSSVQIELKVSYKNPQNLTEYQASVAATSTASLRSY